jgi:hypothetical protein
MYAAHKSWDLGTISVEVTYNVDESEETSIERTITVPPNLSADQREHLADIATIWRLRVRFHRDEDGRAAADRQPRWEPPLVQM